MNCLIVDDEALAQDVLEHYIERVPYLKLTGKCGSALQAFSVLSSQAVDLMFLDIKMPEMSGLELIRNLRQRPKVILTTAFHEYALDGYELDVSDYLLKPFSFDRFMQAVQKVISIRPDDAVKVSSDTAFFVRSERKLIKINPEEIVLIEALKNYLCIHTIHQKITVLNTLSNVGEELKPFPYLYRVHKSFIVNKHFIREIDNNLIRLNNQMEVPLGATYKDAFLSDMRIL